MKKILVISLAIILLLVGCALNTQDIDPITPATEEIENTEVNRTEKNRTEENRTEEVEVVEPEVPLATEAAIFETLPDVFYFQSGAGAWSTDLYIGEDGTFSGVYHDSDMGDVGDKYPNGTVYICNFSGKFSVPEQIDEYTYSMKLESITAEGNPGEEYYEDDIRYIYSKPNGLENADEIIIYLPGAKIADLPEEFLLWSELAYAETMPETLPFFGLYNVNDEKGFVGYVE